jgi:hypothetical protein
MSAPRKLSVSVIFIVIMLALFLFYAPAHYMKRVNWLTVKFGDSIVPADTYAGEPTHREAETYVLVHIPNVGNYLLNFEEEKYREVSSREFFRVHPASWMFKSIVQGQWIEPLPSLKINEYRIATHNGHVVTISF